MSHQETSSRLECRELQEKISALDPWFHNLLLRGIQTAPDHFLGDYPQVKWNHLQYAFPQDLTGMSVLDIGCNAGFYSQALKRRGAARVLGIDTDEHYLTQARFAAEVEGLDIEFRKLPVWDVGTIGERFDIVLFMGVFYHLRHPLLALDLIHQHVARDLLVFQSLVRGSVDIAEVAADYDFIEPAPFDEPGYPRMHFIERSYSHDPTNWWIPNRAGVEAMLRSSGFRLESQPEDETYFCRRLEIAEPPDGPHAVYPKVG